MCHTAWKHLFHSSWKTFKTQFHYILGSLNRHKHLVESQASLVEYEQSKVARLAAENSFEEMAKAEKSRRYLAVAEKIHPPNTRTDHEGAVETRHEHPESGRWILQHRSLRDWMDFTRPDGPVLWINGIPGAGVCLPSINIFNFFGLPVHTFPRQNRDSISNNSRD